MKPTASESVNAEPRRDEKRREYATLRTSWFDAVTSFLTALILFLGTLVLLLAVVWVLSGKQTKTGWPEPPQFVWGTTHPEGFEHDFLEPSVEETVALDEPNLRESLLAVTDVVSHVASIQASLVNQPGKRDAKAVDIRSPGPPGEDDGVVARFERWQLDFAAKDIDSYARQLDHYAIELGLIGGAIQGVDYASNLAEKPRLRHGDSGSEKRLYFMWSRPNPLMQFDRQLLQRAAVQVEGREMLKFIPPELENQLAKIELEYAMARGHGTVNSIVKTVFTSKSDGAGYKFVVSEQRYRKHKD